MTIFLPTMGMTFHSRALEMMDAVPNHFIGAFLIPGGYGFANYTAPHSWIDTVLSYSGDPEEPDESTAKLLDLVETEVGQDGHDSSDGMYLMIWVGIMASPQCPTQLNYVIQHVRGGNMELRQHLQTQIQHGIPTHAEITDFRSYKELVRPDLPEKLETWKCSDWEDYLSYNMSHHGEGMYTRWLKKTFQKQS